MDATSPTAKRQRLSPEAVPSPSQRDAIPSREELVARLLNERKGRLSTATPLIQDLNKDGDSVTSPASTTSSSRPTFELPSFEGSASLLARVQNFLPQLQQANAGLKDMEGVGGGFELIDKDAEDGEDSDEEDEEDTPNVLTRERDLDMDADGDADDADPQIVIDLALGVLEQKGTAGRQDTPDSDNEDSDDTSASDSDTDSSKDVEGDASTQGKPQLDETLSDDSPDAPPSKVASSRDQMTDSETGRPIAGRRKPLIEELS